MEIITELNAGGIIIGLCTFLIIGLFHPIVVKRNIIGVQSAGGFFYFLEY